MINADKVVEELRDAAERPTHPTVFRCAADLIGSLRADAASYQQVKKILAREGFTDLSAMVSKYKQTMYDANEIAIAKDEEIEQLQADNKAMRQEWQEAHDELRKLRGELKWVKEELDIAVEDILDAALTPCTYCLNNPSNGGTCDMYNENHDMFTCWKWRGV